MSGQLEFEVTGVYELPNTFTLFSVNEGDAKYVTFNKNGGLDIFGWAVFSLAEVNTLPAATIQFSFMDKLIFESEKMREFLADCRALSPEDVYDLEPMLALLPSGSYLTTLIDLPGLIYDPGDREHDLNGYYEISQDNPLPQLDFEHPHLTYWRLFPTQTLSEESAEEISRLMAAIEEGKLPTCLCYAMLTDSATFTTPETYTIGMMLNFVLAGQECIEAYIRLGLPVRCLLLLSIDFDVEWRGDVDVFTKQVLSQMIIPEA